MGDAQVFVRTAAWNRDVAAFFHKWQRDIADAQTSDGAMPSVAPHVGDAVARDGGPAWADAGVICPWTMYLCYGDTALLGRHFDSLRRFVASLEKKSRKLIRSHPDSPGFSGYGDWLALDGSGKVEGGTPKDLIGTAFFTYSAGLVARIARILGRTAEAVHHEKLAGRVRRAFQRRFLTSDGLVAGLAPRRATSWPCTSTSPRPRCAPRLLAEFVRDIELRGNKLTTGFVSTSYLPHVLSRHGRLDVAYKLLHQKQWPSWLYAVTQGATTIWERWDGWTPEKGFQSKGMNSFNHYAYGAVGAWSLQRQSRSPASTSTRTAPATSTFSCTRSPAANFTAPRRGHTWSHRTAKSSARGKPAPEGFLNGKWPCRRTLCDRHGAFSRAGGREDHRGRQSACPRQGRRQGASFRRSDGLRTGRRTLSVCRDLERSAGVPPAILTNEGRRGTPALP